jgi:hypothetical protein
MGLFSGAFDIGIDISEAREVVREGLEDALDIMAGMLGNAGQEAIFEDYVEPAFIENTGPIRDGWSDVDIGEYMDFMGEIVDEGNSIMSDAYSEAEDILSEIEEALEEFRESVGERFDDFDF